MDKRNKNIKLIPEEFDVQKWTEFLPPLIPITVNSINNISNTFENILRSRIKEGSLQQYAHLWSLYGKITSYSFSIIQSVQRVIDNEPLLLQTKMGVPTENACCNNGEFNTNLYFSEKDATIQKHNKIIKNLTTLYNKYKNISKSHFFNIRKNTKLLYTPISSDFSKTTIYLAFIKFCKFNTGIELPENLKRLCISNTCNYNKFDSIEEKIISMENDNLIYNKESLNILLNIINRQNILEYDIDPPITTEKLHFEETLQFLLEKQNLNICDKDLLQKFKVLVDRFDVSLVEDDVAVLDLKQHINQINQKMATNLKEKMSTILTRKNKDILFEYFPVGDESDKSINSKRKNLY